VVVMTVESLYGNGDVDGCVIYMLSPHVPYVYIESQDKNTGQLQKRISSVITLYEGSRVRGTRCFTRSDKSVLVRVLADREAISLILHPLYELIYVITCIGNLKEETSCVSIPEFPTGMNTGSMLNI
jgi:hypothetical protein